MVINSTLGFRQETDSLGKVEVPQNALYGAQTQRAVNTFTISGRRPFKAFIWSVAVIKQSAAKVNRDLGLLDPKIAGAIIEASQEVIDGQWNDQFVVDPFQAGAGTSHNMNLNEVIANRATLLLGGKLGEYLVKPNDHVNMSQSTNDVIPTAIRLGCLWQLDELVQALGLLAKALNEKSCEFDDIVKSGRTHLQDAVPIRMGQEFSGYARAVENDTARILASAERLRSLGIGGTAVGTGLNAHPEYHQRMVKELSSRTGLTLYESDNLFERMQSMADEVDFSGSLRTLATTLIKIANDFRLLASGPASGLDELHLPAVQPGSSIMPGKVNPVLPEMLDMAMFHVMGCDLTVTLAAQAGQLELNVMMPIIANSLFDSLQVTMGAVRAFTDKCVVGVQANREKAAGWLEKNSIIVTALNPTIGYAAGAVLVKEAASQHKTIYEVALEKVKQNNLLNLRTQSPLTIEELDKVLKNLRQLTEGGIIE